ncbi:unnamed protein product [Cuscuta campestris]|uniref:CCHC-type domain-containing protein n=1 Tax=Cuscuta campestris TaxID=132261 RepID=A0A484K3R7_9ASTE|nr:unnamed protein product [Cuscuta campestris]
MADEKVEKTEKPVSRVISEEEEIGEKQVTKISPYELRSSDTPALCRGCNCGTLKQIEIQKENERVHQFLMGLDNEGYGSVRSNILSTVPLAPLNRVYSTIVQQEGVLKVTQDEEKNPVSFAVVHNKDVTKDLKCRNCGQTGHEISGCFQIIGYRNGGVTDPDHRPLPTEEVATVEELGAVEEGRPEGEEAAEATGTAELMEEDQVLTRHGQTGMESGNAFPKSSGMP